jgi:intracellular multiplication protein IcmK
MVLQFKRALRVLAVGVALMSGHAVAADKALPPPPAPASINNDPSVLLNAANEAANKASMQAQAEDARAQDFERMKDRAFEGVLANLMPLSTDQIRTFMQRLEVVQKSSNPPSGGAAKPQLKMQAVALDPGAEPPEIHLAAGYVTTLNMLDATGQPWPVGDIGIGGNIEAKTTKLGTHVVRIIPLARFATGNISILLLGYPTPIVFRFVSGTPDVHMRYDARIPSYGPNAKMPIIDKQKLSAGDGAIMSFLDNAPPQGAKKLHVAGVDMRTTAWQYNEKVFVRTSLSMLSPAWDASVASADGMTVYQVADAPVLLLSDAGNMVRVRLSKDNDDDR